MATILPTIPRLIFTILEPLSLVIGFLAPILSTTKFVSSQLPSTATTLTGYTLTPTDRILALQLGNVYGLIGMIGVGVLYATTEPKVVRNYLVACAVADVGHLWVTGTVMGYDAFVDLMRWNSIAWGNIGITSVLFLSRLLYFVGALGKDKVVTEMRQDLKSSIEKKQ